MPEDIRADSPLELDKPKLLLGEGKEEVLVFDALLTHLGINNIRVEEYSGKDKLPDYLDTLKRRPGFNELASLGVTRDADADALNAFTSVKNLLESRDFVTPPSSGHVERGTPSVGIMIIHLDQNSGMLEDLFLGALQGDAILECIDQYFECVRKKKEALSAQASKARIHAWLAAQDPPDMRLGIASQKGIVEWGHHSFDLLQSFIRSL